ncbi:hypothetical protein J8L88_21995 [Aquimarina sp. MMG015]|nr:hypothetical protein [Aquimarina sp. MMG015]
MQTCINVITSCIVERTVRRSILVSISADTVISDGVSKDTNFILSMSGVAYSESEKQLQDCIYR